MSKLNYEIEGSGPKLVLIGGFACNIGFWDSIRDQLARDFQLLLFDNRGMGRSKPSTSPYTVKQMADDAVSLMKELDFLDAHLLGSSLGGAIVQSIAHRYSFKKIIISNSFIKIKPKTKLHVELLLQLIEHKLPLPFLVDYFLPWGFSDNFLADEEKRDRVKRKMVEDPFPPNPNELKLQAAAMLAFDSMSWFHEISSEALIIHGEQDIYCPKGDAVILAEGIPNAFLHFFPKQSHSTHIEEPEEYARVVKEFLFHNRLSS